MTRSSGHRDLERELSDWLHAAAPSPAPDLADRLLRRTAATRQRRRWSGWSFMVPALGGAALAVVLLFVGMQLWKIGPEPFEPLATPPPGVETPSVLAETPAPSDPSPSAVEPSPSLILPPPEPSPSLILPPPEPSPSPSASPSPSPSAEVFPNGQRCHNDSIGYTVSYPAGWWANDAIPRTPTQYPYAACRAFAPTEFELTCCDGVQPAIFFGVTRDTPFVGEVVLREDTTVDGRPATVREIRNREPYYPDGTRTRTYEYLIDVGAGETLVVYTNSARPVGGYARDKRVIDKMMQTLRFDR